MNAAKLTELRDRATALNEDIRGAEKELRTQGYQGVPYYLKNAGAHLDQVTLSLIQAVGQAEADAHASAGMEKMAGRS